MTLNRIITAGLFLALGAAPSYAQPRIEVDAYGGWTFSDGVSGTAVVAGDGNTYNRIDPKDGGSIGFSVGTRIGEEGKGEFGFMYGHQFSNLVAGGTADRELGSWGIDNYHGYFGYNFAEHDAKVVPFFYGGLGATHYGGVTISGIAVPVGAAGTEIGSSTKFSTTWGGGVKYFVNPKVGIRAAGSWTPTYIKSDAGGWWCDPYWGCYLVGNAQYSNQLTLSGGVSLRF